MKWSEIKTLEDLKQYNKEKSKRYYEKNREKVIARNKANYWKKIEELRLAEERMAEEKETRTTEEILLETLGIDPADFIDE